MDMWKRLAATPDYQVRNAQTARSFLLGWFQPRDRVGFSYELPNLTY